MLEVLVRALASKHCAASRCYVSVDGAAPSGAFAARLADVPRVLPLPEDGVPGDEGPQATVIDLFNVQIRSRDRAEVSAALNTDLGGTFLAYESCTYQFSRGLRGWEVEAGKTLCLAL